MIIIHLHTWIFENQAIIAAKAKVMEREAGRRFKTKENEDMVIEYTNSRNGLNDELCCYLNFLEPGANLLAQQLRRSGATAPSQRIKNIKPYLFKLNGKSQVVFIARKPIDRDTMLCT